MKKIKEWGARPEIKIRKKPVQHETKMITACVRWFKLVCRDKVILKLDNEGKRNIYAGKQKKDEGLLPGASDLFIAEPIAHVPPVYTQETKKAIVFYHGAWLEGKYGSNTLSPEQIAFQKDMHERNYYVGTFYSLEEFVAHVNAYFLTDYKL